VAGMPAPEIQWAFLDTGGHWLAAHRVADPRYARTLAWADPKGSLHGSTAVAIKEGLLEIKVPAVPAQMLIEERDGRAIGRIGFDPGIVQRSSRRPHKAVRRSPWAEPPPRRCAYQTTKRRRTSTTAK
jgi:hypothetical protein